MDKEMKAQLAIMDKEMKAKMALMDEGMKIPLAMLASLIHYTQERDNINIDPDGTIYYRSCSKCVFFDSCPDVGLTCAKWATKF